MTRINEFRIGVAKFELTRDEKKLDCPLEKRNTSHGKKRRER